MEIKNFNGRFVPKGDTEANWNKAVGFVPLDKEIIIYKKDDTHSVARFKIGDGKTVVQDLPFAGADMTAIEKMIDEKGNLLIEHVDNAVAVLALDIDTKLDKSGGVISGDLSISGDLTIAGTTTTQDTETVLVKNNIVVTNSDGLELLEPGGFAIKTDETNAYGIMYDPNGDGVKIGLGAFDENGKFEYTEGEDQFLATRADSIGDGHTVMWDDTTKKFVDSGVAHSEIVKNTDYADKSKSKAGIVMPSVGFIVGSNGQLGLDNQKGALQSRAPGFPVMSDNMDYAWKIAATTNTEEWTDEEKASACETIGAVKQVEYSQDNTMPVGSDGGIFGRVYLKDFKGKENTALLTSQVITNKPCIPMRTANGNFYVSNPNLQYECANKGYVDDNFVSKTTDTTEYRQVYAKNADGTQFMANVHNQAVANAIPIRDAAGNFYVTPPTISYHCATKGYVDALIANLQAYELTDADKLEIAEAVLAKLPIYNGEVTIAGE